MNLNPSDRRSEKRITADPILLRDDTKFATGKIAFFQYVTVGVFLFLISGFWSLQVRDPEFYSERAERNRVKALPILAPRGKILDRDGRVIVDNHSSFSLILSRENLKEEHLKAIADGLDLDYEELKARVRRFRGRPIWEPIIIKEELTPGDLAFVESHRHSDMFPEMELIKSQRRLYPANGLAAHVVGYVSEISDAELNSLEFARYEPGDVIGKAGIERQYNDHLMGVDGQRQVLVDNMGRERGVLGLKEAIPGKNLQLSIDLDLQVVAELAMEGRKGAVVALDPRTGEVLAMVSRPAYDPNKFAGRIKAADWNELISNPDNPLLDRAIQAQLAPGSTFKPIMAMAGLDSGIADDGFRVNCSGGGTFHGRYFKCWNRKGHGGVDLHKAIVISCDVFFYTLGNRLGIDKIAHYAELAGLGRKTGIDLPHEGDGLVPSTQWKIRNFRQKWYAGETISVSIGQGALTVTPLQLAHAIGGIANRGVWHQPHLVKDSANIRPPRKADLKPEDLEKVAYGMWGVVNEAGTGGRARLVSYDVCGKTGTAQLASNQLLSSKKFGDRNMKDNAWFVAFAPRMNSEIAVVALWEHGEHGNLAAPIARDIIKAYFDKKLRNQRELLAERRPPPPVPPAPAAPAPSEAPPPEELMH